MYEPFLGPQAVEDLKISCAYTMTWYLMCDFTSQENMQLEVIESICYNLGLKLKVFAVKEGEKVFFKGVPHEDDCCGKDDFEEIHTQLCNFFINCDDVEIKWCKAIEKLDEFFEHLYGEEYSDADFRMSYAILDGTVGEY